MAIQILPANPRTSFGEKLNAGIGNALGMMEQYQQQAQSAKQLENENQALARMGIDLTGISDPKQRQQYVAAALQGANQRELEMMKQQGRQQVKQQEQDFLGQLFGQKGTPQTQEGALENQGQFNPGQLSDADIAQAASINPNLGRLLQSQKDASQREKREQENLEFKKMKESPEHRRETQLESSQAQADVKYNANLQDLSKQHELKQQTLERLDKLNKQGVTGKPYEKLLEKMGLTALTTSGRREFAADVKNLITDIRSILGGQFSAFEFQTILNAYPSADFSKDANAAIIKNLKEFQEIKSKEVEFAQELKKENKGKIPFDFQAQVNEKVREFAATKVADIKKNTQKILHEEYGIPKGNVLMFDPSGEPMNVPEADVIKLLEAGASLP